MNERENTTRKVPILDLPQLTDERWNQLAYQNWMERQFNDLMDDMHKKSFLTPLNAV